MGRITKETMNMVTGAGSENVSVMQGHSNLVAPTVAVKEQATGSYINYPVKGGTVDRDTVIQSRLVVRFPIVGNDYHALALAMAVQSGEHHVYLLEEKSFVGIKTYNMTYPDFMARVKPMNYEKLYFGKTYHENKGAEVWNGITKSNGLQTIIVKGMHEVLVDALNNIPDAVKQLFKATHEYDVDKNMVFKKAPIDPIYDNEKPYVEDTSIEDNIADLINEVDEEEYVIIYYNVDTEAHESGYLCLSELSDYGLTKPVTGAYRALVEGEYRKLKNTKKNQELSLKRVAELNSI